MPLDTDDLPEDIPELDDIDIDVASETAAGDVRDAMLQRIKGLTKPWNQMTQDEQNRLVEGLGYDGRRLVETVVQIVTDSPFPRAVGRIAKMVVIPGDKARIECPVHFQLIPENLETLGVNVGSMVSLVMVDASKFKGQREPARAKTEPDQPDLPMSDQALQQAGDELAPDPDSEIEGRDEPVDSDEIAAIKAEIATEAGDFEASAEELGKQATRGKIKAEREAAA